MLLYLPTSQRCSMDQHSLISVVIPTRDRPELTTRAIHSVVSRRPELVEIIVVDDGGASAYSFGARANASGTAVKVVRTPMNRGPALARKLGVQNSSGPMIAFLDSDDIYDPGWIDSVLRVLEKNPAGASSLLIVGKVKSASFVTGRCFAFL